MNKLKVLLSPVLIKKHNLMRRFVNLLLQTIINNPNFPPKKTLPVRINKKTSKLNMKDGKME